MHILASNTVILVDTDPEAAGFIQKYFQAKGLPLVHFKSAQEAIFEVTSEKSEIKDVSLIITDMYLPGSLNGKELVDILHARHPKSVAMIIVNRPVNLDVDAVSQHSGYTFVYPSQAPDTLKILLN